VRQALAPVPAGTYRFTDYLELADGTSVPISVAFTIHAASPENSLSLRERAGVRVPWSSPDTTDECFVAPPAATIDFTGTGPVVNGNLNANRAIVTAATIYVLRLLVAEDIPLNHGVIRAIDIRLPTCLLNPEPGPTAETSPADAGGNVETSQRVVDVLLGALGVAGASQGTMNNVIFGDSTFGYYETICGGSGATADGDGASAVQVHMTNTRLTDPEIFERRFPASVEEFAIRRNSGGSGKHRGGDGVVRRLKFLRPLTLSVLAQRRGPHPPYGTAGGQPGATGRNLLVRSDGTQIELPGITQIQVDPGDTLTIKTPGGGGYGPPPK
jgi:5-oxoprolinase (ATP-hydrolysing)